MTDSANLKKAAAIVLGMTPWFKDINSRKRKPSDDRTAAETLFDSGVFAASELVRRLTGDENLALAVHEVCIWRQIERTKADPLKQSALPPRP